MLAYQFEIVNELIHYNAEQRTLYGSIYHKALKFVSHKCIHYISSDHIFTGEGKAYAVLPLNLLDEVSFKDRVFEKIPYSIDYNFTTYTITITYNKGFKHNFLHCNCQGWEDKDSKGEVEPEGIMCSHTLALKMFWKGQAFEKKLMQGAYNYV